MFIWTALRRIASLSTYSLADIVKIFSKLEDFLKEEPAESFIKESSQRCSFKFENIPLYINPGSLPRLRNSLSEYPGIYRSGISVVPNIKPNFLHLLGQFLIVVDSKLSYMGFNKNDDDPVNKAIKSLHKIWGSEENMRADALLHKLKGKSNSSARNEILKKVIESKKVLEKITD